MPGTETQAWLTLIFPNKHSVYTSNHVPCWSASPSLEKTGPVHLPKTKWIFWTRCETLKYWNETISVKKTSIFSNSLLEPQWFVIPIPADQQFKPFRKQKMIVLLPWWLLWKECTLRAFLFLISHDFYFKYKELREINTHLFPETQPTVFSHLLKWRHASVTE